MVCWCFRGLDDLLKTTWKLRFAAPQALQIGLPARNLKGVEVIASPTIKKSIILILTIAAFLAMVSIAMAGIFVVVDRGTVKIHDAKTGAYKRSIATPGAIAASTDGETIAVVTQNGSVKRYDAKGNHRGHVGSGKYVFRGSPKSMRHQGFCFGTSR